MRAPRRPLLPLLCAVVTVVAGLGLASVGDAPGAAAAVTDVRINEVESNGDTRDWIELTNVGTATVDVGGWVLMDNTMRSLKVPSGTTLAPGAFLAVDVDDPAVTGNFGLGASDSARVYLPDGTTLVDSYTWTAHATTTYGRCPDGTGSFVTTVAPTKGAANNCGGVVVNEVESNGDTIGDFAELTNTSAAAIDVSGWKFTDSEPERAGHVYSIPSGTTIQPGGYYVLTEAAFGFGLGAPDAVRLLRPDGTTLVDSYTWTAHASTTYGRCPDGTGPFVTTTASTRGSANSCAVAPPVRINEVESDGGTPGDWVELVNNGSTTVDVGGYVLKDSNDTPSYTIPAGRTIAAGGYLVLENPTDFTFGLGAADAARLFAADGTTLVDSYSWTAHATTTYGRCPHGTGDFATTQASTKGAVNSCPGDLATKPWPGGQSVRTVDPQGTFTSNLSGLFYEPTGTAQRGPIWAVKNGAGTLYRLAPTSTGYAPSADFGVNGKLLHYPDGTGDVDAEGVTLTSAGPSGGVFVASERNNDNGSVSRPAVLRYDPSSGGTDLSAQRDWNLTADLPNLGPNLGLEAIAWVPDSYLTARGFVDETTGTAYDPSRYAGHGSGLFLVGVEQTGRVYAYALDQTSNAYTRVASFASGFVSVMELYFEPETQKLWVVCDDGCQGRSARFDVNASGALAPVEYYERPTGMPNLNNEGFTLAPQTECVDGLKPAFWADDSSTSGYALRQGTVSCMAPTLRNTTAPTISGTPRVGAAVTATPGTWDPADVTLAYQWLANGVAIDGATVATYTPTAAQDGTILSVRVTASRAGSASVSATSAGVRVVTTAVACTTPPVISGGATVGSTLTLSSGTWNYADLTFTYAWYADGAAIRGATKPSYVVPSGLAGRRITGRVVASRPGSDSVAATSSNSVTPTTS